MPAHPRRLAALAALVVGMAGCASARQPTFAERKARHEPHKQQLLTEFDLSDARIDLEALYSPGVDRDGIVSLDEPQRWNIGESSFPADDARVIEVSINGESVAYPLAIMGVHEIANDTVGGVPVAVTYCPLCDSASVVDRTLPDGEVTELGVSGLLYQSNLTMYDRTTDSLWSQAGMTAVTGPWAGRSLHHRPVEPEVGSERLALAALLERGLPYVYAGPDVWTPTRDRYPECFEADGLHPNELGMKIMAEGWYRTIAGPDARQHVIDALYARDYDVETMMRRYIRRRRSG